MTRAIYIRRKEENTMGKVKQNKNIKLKSAIAMNVTRKELKFLTHHKIYGPVNELATFRDNVKRMMGNKKIRHASNFRQTIAFNKQGVIDHE